jgi:hypothetical protein
MEELTSRLLDLMHSIQKGIADVSSRIDNLEKASTSMSTPREIAPHVDLTASSSPSAPTSKESSIPKKSKMESTSAAEALRDLLQLQPAKNVMTLNAIKPIELKVPLTYAHIGAWWNRAKQIDADAVAPQAHGRFLSEDLLTLIQKAKRERNHDKFVKLNPGAVFDPDPPRITRLEAADLTLE